MGNRWMRGITLKILYPLLMFFGAFSKNKKDSFQRFIINLNNKLVTREKLKPEKIILLLPHCLQTKDCDARLTYNIYNCKGCGKCEIKDLIQIAEENHLTLFIATGGSLARRIINDVKPDAVVAVACENDLSSGIADSYPIPVLGIANVRPFGPCMNTSVDLAKVKKAIEFFGVH
ncbi:MAG: DUF116 domain-containing protein [Nitrospirae bacterium]|jgi:uncharacterized protein|nr:DUF116 domain-containing protein [Nitrospirota bacterium]